MSVFSLLLVLWIPLPSGGSSALQHETAPVVLSQDSIPDVLARIRSEGLENSRVHETVGYLADVIGARLTGSPETREASLWARDWFRGLGLAADLEGFAFGRGWGFSHSSLRMNSPRLSVMTARPIAWHPGTDGPIRAPVVRADIRSPADFERYRGELQGRIVLLDGLRAQQDAQWTLFLRHDEEALEGIMSREYRAPAPQALEGFAQQFTFPEELYAFLTEEGAIATLGRSWKHGALIDAKGFAHRNDNTPGIPALTVASEDYDRILRLHERGLGVEVEIDVDVSYFDADSMAYNTIAEIAGGDLAHEVVIAGAHIDSWHLGDGAADNAAGVAVVMEAARILSSLDVPFRRTIQFALWNGHEQAAQGSVHHLRQHYLDRPIPDDATEARLPGLFWFTSEPVAPQPRHDSISVYFNVDGGPGRIRGIHAEGNQPAADIFEGWIEPLSDLGVEGVAIVGTSGSDHVVFDYAGIPGFHFIQDPLDYFTQTHHTQVDTYDHLRLDDLRQSSVVLATFLYHAAMREERIPRKPLPPTLVEEDIATPQAAAVPEAEDFDTSGIDLFWATADRLAAGEELTESDWDAFFSHPGYAVTESSGQRRSVVTHCMVAVFSPDGDVSQAKENPPEGEGRLSLLSRVCDHLATIAERRGEVEQYIAQLQGSDMVRAGNQAAARYLPEGVMESVQAPRAYVLLFEAQGFGRSDAVVMDGFLMMIQGDRQNAEFLGHEFHHAYRDAVSTLNPTPIAAPLVSALDRIVNEGTASMIDKAGYVRTGAVPHGFPTVFLELVAGAPERLRDIDESLANLDPTAEGYEAAATVVNRLSPWGGHLNGVYMAMAIEEAFGREAVVEALTGPVPFFTSYQRAAEQLGGNYFRFSDEAMERITGLGTAEASREDGESG
ncbi:MAG: DUF5700 domain-containing putative Zn-dependent protease [Gemmatimonadota bacterium]